MTCAELLGRLDAGEPLDSPEAKEHAAACASCRLALERWQAATGGFRAWRDEAAPPFLHARIMAGLRVQPAPRPWWAALGSSRRPAWALSAVATVFVAAIGGLVVWHAHVSPRAPEVREADRSRSATSAGLEAARSADLSDRQATAEPQASRPAQPPLPKAPPVESRIAKGLAGDEEARTRAAGAEAEHLERAAAGRLEAKLKEEVKDGRAGTRLGLERSEGGFAPEPPAALPQAAAPPTAPRPALAEEAPPAPLGAAAHEQRSADRPAPAREREDAELRPQSGALSAGFVRDKALTAIRCRLVSLADGVTRTVGLPLSQAPRPGETWALRVEDDGRVNVSLERRPEGRAASGSAGQAEAKKQARHDGTPVAIEDEALDAVRALALPPGRYRVERDQ